MILDTNLEEDPGFTPDERRDQLMESIIGVGEKIKTCR